MSVVFLVLCATYYVRGAGFTSFIAFADWRHDTELSAVRSVPHVHEHGRGYDGEFYSQFAVDPLLRDFELDRAIDNPAYRGHRILFSWTAFVFGLGQPAWILNAYALQNVVAWLILAYLLLRWLPPTNVPNVVMWAGCMFAHGTLVSVRYALVDGPALVLIVGAVALSEAERTWRAVGALSLATLGRETALVGTPMLLAIKHVRTQPLRFLFLGALVVLPLAVWTLALATRYGARIAEGAGLIGIPFVGVAWKVRDIAASFADGGLSLETVASVLVLTTIACQAVYVLRRLSVEWPQPSPWLLTALSFLVLTVLSREAVWAGSPGAITRVALPFGLAARIFAARDGANVFWTLLLNLDVTVGLMLFAGGAQLR